MATSASSPPRGGSSFPSTLSPRISPTAKTSSKVRPRIKPSTKTASPPSRAWALPRRIISTLPRSKSARWTAANMSLLSSNKRDARPRSAGGSLAQIGRKHQVRKVHALERIQALRSRVPSAGTLPCSVTWSSRLNMPAWSPAMSPAGLRPYDSPEITIPSADKYFDVIREAGIRAR